MKILFLSTWFPYPLAHGGKIRAHYLLRALARRHRVCLVSFADVPVTRQLREPIREMCERLEVVDRDPFAVTRLRWVVGHLARTPASVAASYSADMAERVRAITASWRPDAIVSLTFATAVYAAPHTGVPRIVDVDNVISGLLRDAVDSAPALPARARRWMAWQKFRRFERRLFRQFDACTVVSDQEQRALAALLHVEPRQPPIVEQVPNGVDTATHRQADTAPDAHTLIFNGAVTYAPNRDAVAHFLRDIFPRILADEPNAKLTVTGATDADAVRRLETNGRVHLTGFLEDVRPAVAASWACVIPLRIGGGTRLKILEAMALGTPVVCTPKGCEGLDVVDGEHALIADTPESFARKTVALLRDPDLRLRLAANARRLVETRYDWAHIGGAFCDLVDRAVARRRPGTVR